MNRFKEIWEMIFLSVMFLAGVGLVGVVIIFSIQVALGVRSRLDNVESSISRFQGGLNSAETHIKHINDTIINSCRNEEINGR